MPLSSRARAALAALCLAHAFAAPIAAEPFATPMQMAVAQAAAADDGIAAFYRARDFAPIWMGEGAEARRAALMAALDGAALHGLPTSRYDPAAIRAAFATARTPAERGALEVETTRRLLAYAGDVSSGILDPRRADPEIKFEPARPEAAALLEAFAGGDPAAVLRGLLPATPRYNALLRARMRLLAVRDAGGWGPQVPSGLLERGASGPAVLALRDRLVAMGHMERTAAATFDAELEAGLRAFQAAHGLTPDGVAGPATLREVNRRVDERLTQLAVNLERQRWLNRALEPRHVLVNLAEQHAYVVDDGRVTFDTVVVIGADTEDRRTPEFSHSMTHMVVNPSWYVPRSIATKEYLPQLRRGGARHLEVYSRAGRVNPNRIDFSRYTERTFPFSLRQPPGPRNALGSVKFMFPNQWNIYLHDTPARSLFGREVRTFSHGCVRVGRPAELAAHLLAPQEADPMGTFQRIRSTGRERRVNLEQPIGVHIVYWSAWVSPEGELQLRGDPYGRDARIARALRAAGVELGAAAS